MCQPRDTGRSVRLTKKRRLRPARVVTFRDLHSSARKGEPTLGQGGCRGEASRVLNLGVASAQQNGGGELVANHVLT